MLKIEMIFFVAVDTNIRENECFDRIQVSNSKKPENQLSHLFIFRFFSRTQFDGT